MLTQNRVQGAVSLCTQHTMFATMSTKPLIAAISTQLFQQSAKQLHGVCKTLLLPRSYMLRSSAGALQGRHDARLHNLLNSSAPITDARIALAMAT